MTSSGTFSFQPSAADLVLSAFGRIQIRPSELTTEHLNDAATECNLLSVQFTNRNPNQWMQETDTFPLVQGTATYTLPTNPNRLVAIGILYLTTGTGGSAFDRPLGPISATDYGALPNKATQGPPTAFWLNLQNPNPQMTFWPVPDGNGPYTANVQCFRQMQDVSLAGGQTLDAPYRFLDAFVAGLAYRLSRIYARPLAAECKMEWEEAWQEAAARDMQDVNLYFVPGLSSYFN